MLVEKKTNKTEEISEVGVKKKRVCFFKGEKEILSRKKKKGKKVLFFFEVKIFLPVSETANCLRRKKTKQKKTKLEKKRSRVGNSFYDNPGEIALLIIWSKE